MKAESIVIGADSSILAHVEEGSSYTDGNVELRAKDIVEETWKLAGIDGFNWRQSEAGIRIGMGAQITGADIIIEASAEATKTLKDIKPENNNMSLIIGPEGGLSSNELLELEKQNNILTIKFGPRILRTETAALSAITAIQLLWGDLLK